MIDGQERMFGEWKMLDFQKANNLCCKSSQGWMSSPATLFYSTTLKCLMAKKSVG